MNQQAIAAATLRRRLLVFAAMLGALAVLAGAFGAHALSARVSTRMLDVWATSVRYQMWHVLALLVASALAEHLSVRLLRMASYAWAAGLLVFCGSLYALVISGSTALGAVTPVGGLLLAAGWVLFAVAAWRGPEPRVEA